MFWLVRIKELFNCFDQTNDDVRLVLMSKFIVKNCETINK